MPDIIRRKLRSLKQTLRLFAALDGFAAVIIALAGFIVLDIASDCFFEFSRPFRCAVLLGGIVLFGWAVYRWIFRRCCTRINDEQLAGVFERFVPPLNESLITSVEYGQRSVNPESEENAVFHSLFYQTLYDATAHLQRVDIRRFFRWKHLFRQVLFAAAAVGLITAFFVRFAETSEIWFSRNLLLSEREYPRKSQLIADGFLDGKIRIGRGDSFTLTVRANTAMPLVPDLLKVYAGSKESGFRTLVIDQFRIDTINGTDWRVFSYTFSECLESLLLAVRGADSFLDGLEIEVVPLPTLSDISIEQEFPKYMNRPARTAAASGRTTLPDGTTVTVHGISNKPLRKADAVVNKTRIETAAVSPVPQENSNVTAGSAVQFSLQKLREEASLEFQLEDEDDLHNKKPIRLDFGIAKDQPPVITVTLEGIGTAVTPNAVLPATGEIADDYGIASVFFHYSVEKGKEQTPPESPPAVSEPSTPNQGMVAVAAVPKDTPRYAVNRQMFSVADCGVQPGDTLLLNVEATDLFDLDGSAGQTGLGPKWLLEIVTPEKLKSLLEVREIGLRQRFEVLIGEVEKTKAIIGGFSLEPSQELIQQAEALTNNDERESVIPDTANPDAGNKRKEELEIKKKVLIETIVKEQADSGQYNISRTLRDTQKESYETRTITESFRLIRQEMVNNRIFNDDEQQRLDKRIIEPMQKLYDGDFPELDRLTELLNETLAVRDKPLRSSARQQQQAVLAQFDAVLKSMTTIRDSMISMESFNEAVELLRAIIKQQQQLRNETQEEKNKRLKGLLE